MSSDIHGTREELVAMIVSQHAEIERLRTAFLRIVSLAEKNVPKYAQQIAREALAE